MEQDGLTRRFGDVELPFSVRMGKTRLPAKTLLSLRVGGVLQMGKIVGEPMDVLLGEQHMASGEMVVVNDRFAVRLVQVLSPEEIRQAAQEEGAWR